MHPLWTPPIYDILFLNFSQGAILRSFTYSNSFGFDRRRLGRLSGRPRTDLTDDLLPVHTILPSDRIHGHGHRCIVTLPENCVSSRHRPSPLTLQEMLRGSRKACWMPTSSPNGKEPKEARRGCAIGIAIAIMGRRDDQEQEDGDDAPTRGYPVAPVAPRSALPIARASDGHQRSRIGDRHFESLDLT